MPIPRLTIMLIKGTEQINSNKRDNERSSCSQNQSTFKGAIMI